MPRLRAPSHATRLGQGRDSETLLLEQLIGRLPANSRWAAARWVAVCQTAASKPGRNRWPLSNANTTPARSRKCAPKTSGRGMLPARSAAGGAEDNGIC